MGDCRVLLLKSAVEAPEAVVTVTAPAGEGVTHSSWV
jgi:hypothetical protein